MSGEPLGDDDHVVIVGASLAGLRAAQALRAGGFDGAVTLLGDEPHPPYDRPPLSKQLLSGEWPASRLSLVPGQTMDPFVWRLGERASRLDLENRRVEVEGGEQFRFDGLIVATGARPRALDPNSSPPGDHLHTLRTVDDCVLLASRLAGQVVVVGAGFIGCEVASTASRLGAEVTLVEPTSGPMQRSLGARVGEHLLQAMRDAGVTVLTRCAVEAVDGASDRSATVILEDGSRLSADCVVVGIGAVPNTEWLEGSGLTVDDGLVCDDKLFAADRVVAAGDVARYLDVPRGTTVRDEHWTSAVRQAELAARNLLAGRAAASPYVDPPYVWSDQFGRRIEVLGRPSSSDDDDLVWGDLDEGRYVVAYRDHQGRLTGFAGVNAMRQFLTLRKRLQVAPQLDEELVAALSATATKV